MNHGGSYIIEKSGRTCLSGKDAGKGAAALHTRTAQSCTYDSHNCKPLLQRHNQPFVGVLQAAQLAADLNLAREGVDAPGKPHHSMNINQGSEWCYNNIPEG
jgi:hypothetical protein